MSAVAADPLYATTRQSLRVFAASAIMVLIDQLTKALARGGLALGEERSLIPNLLQLTHVQNRGAAFGLFPSSTLGLSLVSLGVCAALVLGRGWWSRKGLAISASVSLVLGGALGNLIDRVAFGEVTDFILFTPALPLIGRWPAFNVADAALTSGALLMALSLARSQPQSPGEPTARSEPA